MVTRCVPYAATCGRLGMIFRNCWRNFALISDLKSLVKSVKAIPGQGSNVPITLLGSSGFSAQLAGILGLPFAFAAHFAPEYLYAAAQLYRQRFQPSEALSKPYFMVAVQVIAAETDQKLAGCSPHPSSAF